MGAELVPLIVVSLNVTHDRFHWSKNKHNLIGAEAAVFVWVGGDYIPDIDTQSMTEATATPLVTVAPNE